MVDLGKWAEYLLDAEARRVAVSPITDLEPGLTEEDGYAIQSLLIQSKVSSGDRVVGAKLGLTSKAKQQAMRIEQPIYGVLTSNMTMDSGTPLLCSELIHPRVEPEIVFILGEDLCGPGVNGHDVLDATRWVTTGLEVIDSRYSDFNFKHPDVTADNTSAARFILGTIRREPNELPDLSLLGCNFNVNGHQVATATGAAILGHPASTVALLANWLALRGAKLKKGEIVLSGGLTNAFPITSGGHVSATFGHLGTVTLRGV